MSKSIDLSMNKRFAGIAAAIVTIVGISAGSSFIKNQPSASARVATPQELANYAGTLGAAICKHLEDGHSAQRAGVKAGITHRHLQPAVKAAMREGTYLEDLSMAMLDHCPDIVEQLAVESAGV